MKQFNLEKWLQDKSLKVVTRDGRKVRILCWDAESSKPIVALVSTRSISQREFHDLTVSYFNDGTYYGGATEAFLDLFFADEEEELTEFEKELRYWIGQSLCNYENNGCVSDNMSDSVNIYLKAASKKLLELARKEIEEEKELTEFESDLFTAFSDAWQQYLRGESVDVAEWAKEHSKDLLESARKELEKILKE